MADEKVMQNIDRLLGEVRSKLEKGSEKYKDAYLFNDAGREWNEELIDLVGWLVMQSVRIREQVEGLVKQRDLEYFEQFFKNQKTEFLMQMLNGSAEELKKRKVLNYTIDTPK